MVILGACAARGMSSVFGTPFGRGGKPPSPPLHRRSLCSAVRTSLVYVQGLPFVRSRVAPQPVRPRVPGTFRITAEPLTSLAVDAACQTASVAEAGVKGACPLGRRPFQRH